MSLTESGCPTGSPGTPSVLGEFAPRTERDVFDGVLPKLGLYDPVRNVWTMLSEPVDTREYMLLPDRRIMRFDSAIAGKISAWVAVLP